MTDAEIVAYNVGVRAVGLHPGSPVNDDDLVAWARQLAGERELLAEGRLGDERFWAWVRAGADDAARRVAR